jgi:Stage II sporulation protein E (SpoIIE)/MalT-like TPR region
MDATLPANPITAAQAALLNRRYPAELLAYLDTLDSAAIRVDPWLALFQGRRLCRLHSRFAEATTLIDGALALFRARGDGDGALWALAEWVVMRYHADEFAVGLAGVDPAIDRPMRPYLRAELHFGRFLCLIGVERLSEAVVAGEAALAALETDPDAWLQLIGRIQALRNIAAGYHYLGQARRSVAAAESAVWLAQEHPDAADTQPWCFYELGLAYWRKGQLADATQALDRARRLAETWQHRELWRWSVAAQGHVLRDQDRLEAALAAYQLANGWGEDPEGPAGIQLRQGRLTEARWSCEARMALAEQHRELSGLADAKMLLALVELKNGRPADALVLLEQVCATYAATDFGYHYATAQLYRAAAALPLDRDDIVAAGVAHYLRFAAREEVLNCVWWMPDLIEPLLVYGLQHGIEPAWARRFLEQRFVHDSPAPAPAVSLRERTELEIAHRMQLSLLPELPPVMPDLDLAAIVLPASEIGGDFVGYFPHGAVPEDGVQRQLGIAIGDISGKGLSAALLLSGTVVALNTVATPAAMPAQVAAALHSAMRPYTSRSRMNIAFCYTLLVQQANGWSLGAVGAGAMPPLIRRANGAVAWLDTIGFPIGTLTVERYHEVRDELLPGDVLILMSDGIVEAMNAQRELFGFERLAQTIAELPAGCDAQSILTAVLRTIQRHNDQAEQQDDITLVVVRVLAGTPA